MLRVVVMEGGEEEVQRTGEEGPGPSASEKGEVLLQVPDSPRDAKTSVLSDGGVFISEQHDDDEEDEDDDDDDDDAEEQQQLTAEQTADEAEQHSDAHPSPPPSPSPEETAATPRDGDGQETRADDDETEATTAQRVSSSDGPDPEAEADSGVGCCEAPADPPTPRLDPVPTPLDPPDSALPHDDDGNTSEQDDDAESIAATVDCPTAAADGEGQDLESHHPQADDTPFAHDDVAEDGPSPGSDPTPVNVDVDVNVNDTPALASEDVAEKEAEAARSASPEEVVVLSELDLGSPAGGINPQLGEKGETHTEEVEHPENWAEQDAGFEEEQEEEPAQDGFPFPSQPIEDEQVEDPEVRDQELPAASSGAEADTEAEYVQGSVTAGEVQILPPFETQRSFQAELDTTPRPQEPDRREKKRRKSKHRGDKEHKEKDKEKRRRRRSAVEDEVKFAADDVEIKIEDKENRHRGPFYRMFRRASKPAPPPVPPPAEMPEAMESHDSLYEPADVYYDKDAPPQRHKSHREPALDRHSSKREKVPRRTLDEPGIERKLSKKVADTLGISQKEANLLEVPKAKHKREHRRESPRREYGRAPSPQGDILKRLDKDRRKAEATKGVRAGEDTAPNLLRTKSRKSKESPPPPAEEPRRHKSKHHAMSGARPSDIPPEPHIPESAVGRAPSPKRRESKHHHHHRTDDERIEKQLRKEERATRRAQEEAAEARRSSRRTSKSSRKPPSAGDPDPMLPADIPPGAPAEEPARYPLQFPTDPSPEELAAVARGSNKNSKTSTHASRRSGRSAQAPPPAPAVDLRDSGHSLSSEGKREARAQKGARDASTRETRYREGDREGKIHRRKSEREVKDKEDNNSNKHRHKHRSFASREEEDAYRRKKEEKRRLKAVAEANANGNANGNGMPGAFEEEAVKERKKHRREMSGGKGVKNAEGTGRERRRRGSEPAPVERGHERKYSAGHGHHHGHEQEEQQPNGILGRTLGRMFRF